VGKERAREIAFGARFVIVLRAPKILQERRRRSSKGNSDPLILRWEDERKGRCFLLSGGEWGEGVAAVDAPEAADRTKAGMVKGSLSFILRSECISRVIKFDSKQTKDTPPAFRLGAN
jgi:hypothetical protein